MLIEFLEVFHNIEGTKDKTSKAGPNLEGTVTIQQGIDCSIS